MTGFDQKCPFCGGTYGARERADGSGVVYHTEPYCDKFRDEDPIVFLRNARVATYGTEPDDKDWPLPGKPSDEKELN